VSSQVFCGTHHVRIGKPLGGERSAFIRDVLQHPHGCGRCALHTSRYSYAPVACGDRGCRIHDRCQAASTLPVDGASRCVHPETRGERGDARRIAAGTHAVAEDDIRDLDLMPQCRLGVTYDRP
jgi:hypothetical protein